MSLGGFTLADRLGARSVPCRVSGCTRTWIQLGGKSLALGKAADTSPDDPAAGMCEPCKKKFVSLHDKQRRCDVPGCQNTWTWSANAQLEAFAAHKPPPKHLCASCEGKLAALEDKQIACTVPGCTRTGTLTKRQQLLAETAELAQTHSELQAEPHAAEAHAAEAQAVETSAAEAPAIDAAAAGAEPASEAPAETAKAEGGDKRDKGGVLKHEKPAKVTITGPMCGPCGDVARRLTDRPVHCGINGCKRKWIWKADDQLQAFAAGKPNEPPRRMCETCRANFGKLLDREVRCRTSGCKKTWTWSRFDQLDACVADKAAPKAPARMCESCFDSFAKMKDVERPCRKAGCKRTWTDKRGAQLARLVRGRSGDPYPQYCVECQKELGDLDDREISCKTEGCSGTWTWSREQQLAAGVRPMPRAQLEEEAGKEAGQEARKEAGQEAGRPEQVEAAPDAGAPTEAAPDAVITAGTSEAEEALPAAEPAPGETWTEATAAAEGAAAVLTGAPSAAHGERGKRGGRGGRNRRRKQRQIQPPERLCHACAEFLKDKKTLEIPCQQCGTPIYWPPESQLQTHLGNWATPAMCGACKRDATEAARLAAKEAIRHQMDLIAHPPADAPAPTEPSTEAPTTPGNSETN
jgi:hypothetical protein